MGTITPESGHQEEEEEGDQGRVAVVLNTHMWISYYLFFGVWLKQFIKTKKNGVNTVIATV